MFTRLTARGCRTPGGAGRRSTRLRLACGFERLHRLRDVVSRLCRQSGIDPSRTAQFVMAVDEACTNIIEHSYGGEVAHDDLADHPGIAVNCFATPAGLTVELIDYGKGFDPTRGRPVTPHEYLSTRRTRGLGLFIIATFVDDLRYTHEAGNGNHLVLHINA